MSKSLIKSVTFVTVFFAILVSISENVVANEKKLSLAERVKHLEELNQTRNQVQADISYRISELQTEVRALTGQVEENTFKLQQIQERQREIYQEIDRRLATQPTTDDLVPSSSGEVNNSQTASATSSADSYDQRNAAKEFEAAFALVRGKQYDASINAFSNFLIKYPNNNLSGNARYWMGQVFLVQGKLNEAEEQFKLLILEFTESDKILPARLKMADIYLKQEKWADAKAQYTEVFNQAEGSQKQLARKGLDKIRQAGH